MYLQEPSTPVLEVKRSKRKKSKQEDDMVAEFLRFEKSLGSSTSTSAIKDTLTVDPLSDSAYLEDTNPIEENIDIWLFSRGILKNTPDQKKFTYFDRKKRKISKTLDTKEREIFCSQTTHKVPDLKLHYSSSLNLTYRHRLAYELEIKLPSDRDHSSQARSIINVNSFDQMPYNQNSALLGDRCQQ